MVVGAQPTLEEKCVRSTAKGRYHAGRRIRCKIWRLTVQRLPQLASAGKGGIDIEITELVNRLRSHITHGEEEVCWKFPFYDEVPGLDVAPL